MSNSEYVLREQIAREIRAQKLDLSALTDSERPEATAYNLALEQAAKVAEKIPHRSGWVRPDWLILGAPAEGPHVVAQGVMLLACRDLRGAELVRETIGMDLVQVRKGLRPAQIPRIRTSLLSELGAFDTVHAADYQAALRDLFSRWQPRGGEQMQQVEVPPLALPSSDSV